MHVDFGVAGERPIIGYTDAAYHLVVPGGGAPAYPEVTLGFYVRVGGRTLASKATLPLSHYRFFSSNLKTYITQGELYAAIALYFTLPWLFRRQRVVHFVDNTGALSAMVHGYARKPDMARMVNVFHAQMVGLQCEWYGEWVPSKANPADIPTRPERLHELPADVEWVEMALPSVEEIEGDLSGWIARAREARPPAWWVA